jgi:hypothetical protein
VTELRTTRPEAVDGNRWWVSWYLREGQPAFELWSPWWVSGYTDDQTIFCAAVIAEDEEAAMQAVIDSFDSEPDDLEWRFVEDRPADWSPFNDRFRASDWMVWPETQKPTA